MHHRSSASLNRCLVPCHKALQVLNFTMMQETQCLAVVATPISPSQWTFFSGFKVLGCSDAFIKTFGEVTLYARLQQFVDPQAWQPFTRWLALCSIALLSPVSTRKCWNALNMLTCLDKGQPMHAQFKCIFRHDGVVRHYSPDPKLRSLEVMPLQLHLIQEMGERSTRSLISL